LSTPLVELNAPLLFFMLWFTARLTGRGPG
jgi:hypothetical protein